MTDGGLAIAILAAGSATRFGGAKLDAPCAGKPLGRWSVDAATAVAGARIAIVTPPQPPAFVASLSGVELLVNHAAVSGIAASVTTAADWARQNDAAQLLILLADMPLIDRADLLALAHAVTDDRPAACDYGDGRLGVPACWPACFLDRLAMLGGDAGAGRLLHAGDSVRVALPADHLRDVDTADDLGMVENLILSRRR